MFKYNVFLLTVFCSFVVALLPNIHFSQIQSLNDLPHFRDRIKKLTINTDFTGDNTDEEFNQSIVNGVPAEGGQYPFQVYIVITVRRTKDNVSQLIYLACGGSLISKGWVLTAAHCISPELNIVAVQIVLGALDLNNITAPGVIIQQPTLWQVHPKYNSSILDYDVALIRTADSTYDYSNQINRIKLADLSYKTNSFLYEQPMVIGWGRTNGSVPNLSSFILRSEIGTIISNDDCQQTFLGVSPRQICLWTRLQATCNGDSGGPLFITVDGEFLQIGIVSYGPLNCILGIPDVFSRVTEMYSWIVQVTGELD